MLSWPRKTTKIISDDWDLGPRRLERDAERLSPVTLDIHIQTLVSPRLVLSVKFQIKGGIHNAPSCRAKAILLFPIVEHTDSEEQNERYIIPFDTAVSTETVRQWQMMQELPCNAREQKGFAAARQDAIIIYNVLYKSVYRLVIQRRCFTGT